MPAPDRASVKPTSPPPGVPKELRAGWRRFTVVCATLLIAALLVAAGGALFIAGGFYDISVTAQHTQPVYALLEKTMERSVKRRAREHPSPPLGAEPQVRRGAACYRDKCLQCHGGPGVAQGEIGLSMQPLPGPLVDAAVRWSASELYWITREGIKMSGMPAWRYRLSNDDLWAVVAFLQRLPQLDPQQFEAALASSEASCLTAPVDELSAARTPPDAARGKLALHQHACTACHVIPGLAGARVHVGPPLEGLARRQLIAGAVPNTPEQLVRWIRDPHAIDPRTAMPVLGVSESSARDMVAYLATLR
jgi:cytochrome c1